MRIASWHRLSLRRTLLVVLLPSMLVVAGVEMWLTWRATIDAANAAYDRSLYGAIKAIDANVSTAGGGIGVELPYRMLEFFQLTASGNVYFRVATEDGLVEVGSADLPRPARPLVTGMPQFVDSTYFGERVRVGSYARPLSRPGQNDERLVIQVAESVDSRADFTRALVLNAFSRDLLLLAVGGALLAALVAWALRPLQRVHDEVRARDPEDLTPIDDSSIPADVVPLVQAINHHVLRSRRLAEGRRRFVDDASHQLRTPLATLATQLAYALREPDPTRVRDALRAIKAQLDDTIRGTNQMLALARSDAGEVEVAPVDLGALAEAVARECWGEAREKRIDLGLEAPADPVLVRVHDGLLREALRNLLHNALKFTPAGGRVTVSVARAPDHARLAVTDNGPGIPAPERSRAGERFFRASNASVPGSGLGLAIVRSVVRRLDGEMQVGAGPDELGCRIQLRLPLASAAVAPPSGG